MIGGPTCRGLSGTDDVHYKGGTVGRQRTKCGAGGSANDVR